MDLSQRTDLTQSVHRSSGSYELVVGAVLFAIIGLVADRAMGTTPWFTISLAVVGLAAASISIYYRYKVSMDHEAAARTARQGGSGPEQGAA